jgi:hypothetical protein
MPTDPATPPPINTVVIWRHSGEETVITRRVPPDTVVDCWRIGVAGLASMMDWQGAPPSALHIPALE